MSTLEFFFISFFIFFHHLNASSFLPNIKLELPHFAFAYKRCFCVFVHFTATLHFLSLIKTDLLSLAVEEVEPMQCCELMSPTNATAWLAL